jgi:hypothetical protein
VLFKKASRRVSGQGLLKCLHFKRSEPESRVAISSLGKLTSSFLDSTPCESPAGETDCGFLEKYTGTIPSVKIDRVRDEWPALALSKLIYVTIK